MGGLGKIFDEYKNCSRCTLCETRTNLVFGDGSEDADIMVIGTAPGGNEDLEGIPFVGDSGTTLKLIAKDAKFRLQDTFITNIVCCRPTMPGDYGRPVDRDPTAKEIAACQERLHKTIYAVDPILIVALGRVALKTLTGSTSGILKTHGDILIATLPGRKTDLQYAVLPTLHPAYLMRNPDLSSGGWVEKVTDDLRKAREIVDRYKSLKSF